MKIAIVLGTRPEILKMSPIIKELQKKQVKHKVYFTGQHFTYEMGKGFFNELGIKISDEYPKKFKREKVTTWLKDKFKEYRPDCVLVQGDTASAMVGALAAAYTHIPIGHVEAGLRSYDFDNPFPEEHYRTIIDSIATYKFCPTPMNYKNVPHKYGKTYVTGNTIIDLIREYHPMPNMNKGNNIIVTAHRRENWDKMEDICNAIMWLSIQYPQYKFIFVRHANKKLAKEIKKHLKGSKVKIVNPMPYKQFINLLSTAKLVISDSGGIIEEASYLNVPLVSMREKTERQEAIVFGTARLAGTNSTMIVTHVEDLLDFKDHYSEMQKGTPFGDGKASKRIIDILIKELGDKK